jgi:hypothetical protein
MDNIKDIIMSWFNKNKSSKELIPLDVKCDWNNDTGFLMWIIDKKVNDFSQLVVKPKLENNDRAIPINDEMINSYVVDMATEIIGLLSERYINTLGKYVKKEMLDTLIIDITYSKILELGIEANIKKIRRQRLGAIVNEEAS